jgi:type IV secretory pathway TrbD component
MTWDKPKNAGQWLLLFAPPGICVASTLLGAVVHPEAGDWMAFSLIGLFIATLVSFGLSIWLARVNPLYGDKIACALACFAILMVVNCAVCFAGCAVGSTMLPGIDFK